MKIISLVAAIYLGTSSLAVAQTSTGGSPAGSTGAGGAAGATLSNGNTISGTGGSPPGPNNSNALHRGTTGNNMGAPQTGAGATTPASHGNAVDTPAANAAIHNLGNTDAGVLKK